MLKSQLSPLIGSKFVTKILTSHSGEQFRVTFLVSLVNGEVRAQVVSAESLGGAAWNSEARPAISLGSVEADGVLSLPIASAKKCVEAEFVAGFVPEVYSFTEFLFFHSQPTRAPSL